MAWAQLQENSFPTITVITAETLTWATAAGAAAGRAIKPLPPPDTTPPGPHSNKQLSTLQPAPCPPACPPTQLPARVPPLPFTL